MATVHLYDGIFRSVLSVAIFALSVFQTMKQSVNMYKATKLWQPNQYMQQLVTDGTIYFLAYVSSFNLHLLSFCSVHLTCLQKN